MAGSFGSLGRLMTAARVVRELPAPVQALVVTGQDSRLATRLREMFRGAERQIRVFSYTDSVRQLMAAADLLVTKAGGVTLAEALAAELPIVCFGSLPGQESGNERFVGMRGAALRARDAAELRNALCQALTDPGILRNVRGKIREIRRPDAARAVVECLLGSAVRVTERAS
jgi:processive 1,2-diacylglycerol beta-glucosyltransferase